MKASMVGVWLFAGVQLACGEQFFQTLGSLQQNSVLPVMPLAPAVPMSEFSHRAGGFAVDARTAGPGGFPYAFCFAVCALAVAGSVRKPIVGGNWKCNGTMESNAELIAALNAGTWDEDAIDVVVCPVALQALSAKKSLKPSIKVALQNVSATKDGAYTGEMSAEQVKDAGLEWVVIGHSERRTLYGETDEVCAEKLRRATQQGLKVLYCIGEQLAEREAGKTNEVCAAQLDAVFALGLKVDSWDNIVIAYEPVWAIGTGKVATPQQAQETHAFIRSYVAEKKSEGIAKKLRIQYGGSANLENCGELMSCPDIDGFLVGGASLKPDFVKIIARTAAVATGLPFLQQAAAAAAEKAAAEKTAASGGAAPPPQAPPAARTPEQKAAYSAVKDTP
jgi:triosephosphate isomerase